MVQGLLQLRGGDALFAEQEFAEPNSHGCVVVAVVVAGKWVVASRVPPSPVSPGHVMCPDVQIW